ncbi:LANO_0C03070g1_1 [Lachancea nothofagi CBS 11611]|uniref:LANO_0C03070g1_1 n=1 Tax=Lachancea nothofagi CBS 11611 TaxID=1266666 RepID=A0A1G4J5F9_9SACH|nr:LANO_0C03070g1_1 [Lachancea nothofagi CBS 11611]
MQQWHERFKLDRGLTMHMNGCEGAHLSTKELGAEYSNTSHCLHSFIIFACRRHEWTDRLQTEEKPTLHVKKLGWLCHWREAGEEELSIDHYLWAIILEELSVRADPRNAQIRNLKAVLEEIKKQEYRTAEDGRTASLSELLMLICYILKHCHRIGPFYGYENLEYSSFTKSDRSSLIALKRICIWLEL